MSLTFASPAFTSVLSVSLLIHNSSHIALSLVFKSLPINVPRSALSTCLFYLCVLFIIAFTVSPFNPCVSLINPSSLTYSCCPCPSASPYFHIAELIPLSPRLQPVVFPVSPLIRLSLALVLLIPEGFVYLCWSCFYSLRLTPPIFSPVI